MIPLQGHNYYRQEKRQEKGPVGGLRSWLSVLQL